MEPKRVGVRELKEHLSQYLLDVKAGNTLVITERGREVGRIIPAGLTVEERMQAMIDAGLASWSGKKLEPTVPVAEVRGDRTVSDLIIEDRDVPIP